MELAASDISVIIIYFAAVLFVGFFASRKKGKKELSTEEYILAGRKITLPIFVATLVATWYGLILGVGEFVYSQGIVAWFCLGLPYYIAAAFLGGFFAKKIRAAKSMTIPEQIASSYGVFPGYLASGIVLFMTIPAAYVLMLGTLIELFTGWALWISIIAGVLLSIAFLFTGGLKADIFTNVLQFFFMYIGFGALVYFAVSYIGSPDVVLEKIPDNHLNPLGRQSLQYVLVWYIIAFQTFVDPGFHQRCAAAKNPQTAQKGIFWAILLWAIFDGLTLTAGLYARAAFTSIDPLSAFPFLGDLVLPPIWKGIFVVALIAAVMSTLESYFFISAATIGLDLLSRVHLKLSAVTLTRIGLLITAVVSILLALMIPSAVDLIYKMSSIAVPGLIIPLIISYQKTFSLSKSAAAAILIASSLSSLAWTLLAESEKNAILLSDFFSKIEPMFVGITVSIIIGLLTIRKKRSIS